jgi:hypothetical protein
MVDGAQRTAHLANILLIFTPIYKPLHYLVVSYVHVFGNQQEPRGSSKSKLTFKVYYILNNIAVKNNNNYEIF